MSPPTSQELHFVGRLRILAGERAEEDRAGSPPQPDRAALAALRRGLGKPPGQAAEMFRYVAPYAAEVADPDWYYVVAALFALHPSHWTGAPARGRSTNLGASLASLAETERTRLGGRDPTNVEQRFTTLLNAHTADLSEHLRRVVALLKTKEIRVDYAQLLHDIRWWSRASRETQRAWAEAFWGSRGGDGGDPPTPPESDASASE